MTSNNNPLDLDAIEARANAATPGPWGFYDGSNYADVAADMEVTSPGSYSYREKVARLEDEDYWDDPAHEDDDEEQASQQMAANAAFIAHAREDVPALLAEVRRLADLVREACMLRDFHRRQADHLAAKRDLAETVLAKWQAGDLKPEQALWMLQDAHAVGDVKTFDQLLGAARPSV